MKRTGNIIPVTKTKSKYEKTTSDKFVKFDCIIINYSIPTFEFDENQKISNKGGWSAWKKAKLLNEIDISKTIDGIVKDIDVSEIEYNYALSLCQPVLKRNLYKPNPSFFNPYRLPDGNIDMIKLATYIRRNMM